MNGIHEIFRKKLLAKAKVAKVLEDWALNRKLWCVYLAFYFVRMKYSMCNI